MGRLLKTVPLLALAVLAACSERPNAPLAPDADGDPQTASSLTSSTDPAAVLMPPARRDGPLRASQIGQPVPASVIVSHNGLDWVWASPCALGGCTAGIDVGHDGFGFATVAQWALRPPPSAFRNPDKCASPWFDYTWNHCDWQDAEIYDAAWGPSYQMSFYGSAPANVGGAAGGWGYPMIGWAETWLVRGVIDNTPPTISFSLSTTELWPPNHKMHTVATGISASDDVDASPTVTVTVSSNEPDDGLGDGDTAGDGVVIDNGDGTYSVQVRAERGGNGTGRVYTITVTATDDAGNTASVSGEVKVPHSKKK